MNHARHAQPPNSSGPSFLCLYWQLKSTYRSAENHHRPVARLKYVPAREKALLSISAMLVGGSTSLPLRRYLLPPRSIPDWLPGDDHARSDLAISKTSDRLLHTHKSL